MAAVFAAVAVMILAIQENFFLRQGESVQSFAFWAFFFLLDIAFAFYDICEMAAASRTTPNVFCFAFRNVISHTVFSN
jgi:hypothetical protein